MRWTYRILALAVLPFGIFSILEDQPGLWFGSDDLLPLTGIGSLVGFAILLPGVLNLLNDAYGEWARGLRLTTVFFNGFMAVLLIRLEMISPSLEMFLLLPILFVFLFGFSLILRKKEGGLKGSEPMEE